jgi:hypothetical protein
MCRCSSLTYDLRSLPTNDGLVLDGLLQPPPPPATLAHNVSYACLKRSGRGVFLVSSQHWCIAAVRALPTGMQPLRSSLVHLCAGSAQACCEPDLLLSYIGTFHGRGQARYDHAAYSMAHDAAAVTACRTLSTWSHTLASKSRNSSAADSRLAASCVAVASCCARSCSRGNAGQQHMLDAWCETPCMGAA